MAFNNNSPVGGAQAKKRNAQGPSYTNASFSTKSGGQPGNPYNTNPIGSGSVSTKMPAKASPKPTSGSPVGGGASFQNSGKPATRAPVASPKPSGNSPVGSGNKNYSQSMPASVPHPSMRPDTTNHNLPNSAPRPTAKPESGSSLISRLLGVGQPKLSTNDFIAKVSRSK